MTHRLLTLSWRLCTLDIVNRLRVDMTTKFPGDAGADLGDTVREAVVHYTAGLKLSFFWADLNNSL